MAQLRMINEPGLVEQVQSSLYEAGMISLTEVRDCISNPRIRDFYVRDLDASGLPLAGISALSEISMLADNWQKTYAISLMAGETGRGRFSLSMASTSGTRASRSCRSGIAIH